MGMHIRFLLPVLALAGCTAMPTAELRDTITTQDMLMNRPNTETQEVLFRMQNDGTGTVEFINGTSGPQDVNWTLNGATYCSQTDEGLMQSFGCAIISILGQQVRLAHTESDNVATGRLVAR